MSQGQSTFAFNYHLRWKLFQQQPIAKQSNIEPNGTLGAFLFWGGINSSCLLVSIIIKSELQAAIRNMKLILTILSTVGMSMVFALPAHHHFRGGRGGESDNNSTNNGYNYSEPADNSSGRSRFGFNLPSNIPGFGNGQQSGLPFFGNGQGQNGFSSFGSGQQSGQGQGGFPSFGNGQQNGGFPFIPSNGQGFGGLPNFGNN